MVTSPSAQPSERRVSAVDQFCTQTYPASEREARNLRGIASSLGVICLALLLCLGIAVSRASAMEQERDELAEALQSERAARIEATLSAKDTEMSVANYTLDTRVRRDIVDDRMLQQQRRANELEQLARQVEREKLVEADCTTPQSVIAAAGL